MGSSAPSPSAMELGRQVVAALHKRKKRSRNAKMTSNEGIRKARDAAWDAIEQRAVAIRQPGETMPEARVRAMHEDPQLYSDYINAGQAERQAELAKAQRQLEEIVEQVAQALVKEEDITVDAARAKAWSMGGLYDTYLKLHPEQTG